MPASRVSSSTFKRYRKIPAARIAALGKARDWREGIESCRRDAVLRPQDPAMSSRYAYVSGEQSQRDDDPTPTLVLFEGLIHYLRRAPLVFHPSFSLRPGRAGALWHSGDHNRRPILQPVVSPHRSRTFRHNAYLTGRAHHKTETRTSSITMHPESTWRRICARHRLVRRVSQRSWRLILQCG